MNHIEQGIAVAYDAIASGTQARQQGYNEVLDAIEIRIKLVESKFGKLDIIIP